MNNILSHIPEISVEDMGMLTQVGSKGFDIDVENSDIDLIGFYFPKKEVTFKSLVEHFESFDPPRSYGPTINRKVSTIPQDYDVTLYNVVHFFKLAAIPSPNVLEAIFLPTSKDLFHSPASNLIREERHVFLSREIIPKYLGWSYSYLKKYKSGEKKFKNLSNAYRGLSCLCSLLYYKNFSDVPRDYIRAVREGKFEENLVKEDLLRLTSTLEYRIKNNNLPETTNRKDIRQLLFDVVSQHYSRT